MARKKIVNWQNLAAVGFHVDGLSSFQGEPNLMSTPHRHNELEFNYVDSGEITYIFGGDKITVSPGFLHVFWAGMPHQVVGLGPGTEIHWVTVPLQTCLQWELPRSFWHELLFSRMLVERDPGKGPLDRALLQRWHRDLTQGAAEARPVLLLEMHGRLRRLALDLGRGAVGQKEAHPVGTLRPGSGLRELGAMAMYINENFRKRLKVEEIAAAANLRPNYAMRLFRGVFGSSLMAYVTQLRVMHAQRLLTLSDAKVIDIAQDAGFASLSNFYQTFEKACGQSPGQYRRSLPGNWEVVKSPVGGIR
jgi:AraC-like DNA-binding protein